MATERKLVKASSSECKKHPRLFSTTLDDNQPNPSKLPTVASWILDREQLFKESVHQGFVWTLNFPPEFFPNKPALKVCLSIYSYPSAIYLFIYLFIHIRVQFIYLFI